MESGYWFKSVFLFIVFLISVITVAINNVFALQLNEIYPNSLEGEFEWVEVYNEEELEVNLSDFRLTDKTGKKIDFIKGSLPGLSYGIATSSQVLNNSGDTIFLRDKKDNLLEIATYSGVLDSFHSIIKCPDGQGKWLVSSYITKGKSNLEACSQISPMVIVTPTEKIISTPTISPPTIPPTIITLPTITRYNTPIPTPISYDNILISEAMVNPPEGEFEWVEVYNGNPKEVLLENWYIDDIADGGGWPKQFSLTIQPYSYQSIELSSSIFNNDGDTVRLLDFDKREKDSFIYRYSQKGKTWARGSLDKKDFCLQEESKNMANGPCINLKQSSSDKTGSINKVLIKDKRPEMSPTASAKREDGSYVRNFVRERRELVKVPVIEGEDSPDILGETEANGIDLYNIQTVKKILLARSLSLYSLIISSLVVVSLLRKRILS